MQQRVVLAELTTPFIKYVVWNNDMSMVALLSKHAIVIADKKLGSAQTVHETIRVKSAAWDDHGVLIYTTLNHIKYCLPNGDSGIIRTLEMPLYITKVFGNVVYALDREAKARTLQVRLAFDHKYRAIAILLGPDSVAVRRGWGARLAIPCRSSLFGILGGLSASLYFGGSKGCCCSCWLMEENILLRTWCALAFSSTYNAKVHLSIPWFLPDAVQVDCTEYMFKLALLQRQYELVISMIKSSALCGAAIIAYLQAKGYPEVALHFVSDERTRFNLALQVGMLPRLVITLGIQSMMPWKSKPLVQGCIATAFGFPYRASVKCMGSFSQGMCVLL